MVISQELISLMDIKGSSRKAYDINDTSLACFIGFHTLCPKKEKVAAEIY